MSDSSPADLAVTFRSVSRRLREAQGDAPATATAGPTGELQSVLGRAAAVVHSTADPDAIADAIERAHVDDWSDDNLRQLRDLALQVGKLLRQVAAHAEGRNL